MAVNYTTYDIRRGRDIIHTGQGSFHRDIMGLATCDPHDGVGKRFWYAHVLGIFHVNVIYVGPGSNDISPRRLDFLWVRFYAWRGRVSKHTLQQLVFPPVTDESSFSFIDPSQVLRACHIIPSFHHGKLEQNSLYTPISKTARNDRDWKIYLINKCVLSSMKTLSTLIHPIRFADRDMYMRFQWGLGVGHVYTYNSSSTGDAPMLIDDEQETMAHANRDVEDAEAVAEVEHQEVMNVEAVAEAEQSEENLVKDATEGNEILIAGASDTQLGAIQEELDADADKDLPEYSLSDHEGSIASLSSEDSSLEVDEMQSDSEIDPEETCSEL